MPLWAPPTPPHDDNDVYIDQTLLFLYEHSVMPETQLPPVYVKKERKKIKVESITTRKQKQKREEQPRVPRSLFDRANAQLLRLRRDAKLQKLKMGQMKPYRPIPPLPSKPVMEQAPDHPEWLIHEDWALLQAVQNYFDVPLNLMIINPAHTPNWDMVADVVNSCSRVYRSPKQCRLRYENVIIPREEGRIMYDMTPRKQKKQKGIYKMSKGNRAMKTGQIHSQDNNNRITIMYSLRFDSTKSIAAKRPPTMRQTLVNPTLKNPKHASVLQDNNIQYDQPLNPMHVAEIRAQRIQREKKQSQQQAAAAATNEQATSSVTMPQRVASQGIIAGSQVTAPTIVAMTTAVTATQLAAIGTSASSATVLTVTGTPLPQATIRQRAPLTVQEISSGTSVVGQVASGVSQVRAQLQTVATTASTALTPVQLAQRISGASTSVQQLTGKTAITPQQFQLMQQQNLISRQKQQQQAVLQQQQQRMQKLIPESIRQPHQLRTMKGLPGQKTVIAQQLVTSMAPGLKAPAGAQIARAISKEEMQLRLQQHQLSQKGVTVGGTTVAQLHHPQTGQIQNTQIIAGTPLQQVSQALSKGQQATGATLVKTVSAPAGSVSIPVSINVSLPQKGVAKVSQINPQQMVLQQRKPVTMQKGLQKPAPIMNAVQIIQQQGRSLTVQQLQQLVKQQSQGGTIQQIIHTSQPTIIATVTQSQATPQMVTKVIATTATIQPTQIQQTVQGAAQISGSSATVTTVPVPSSLISSLPQGHSSMTASIVKPGLAGVEAVTTVQIHPMSSITQSKLTGVAQNVVVTPVQQTVQHITVATPGSSQANIPAGSQVVVSAAPSQTLQVTVPASSQIQTPIQQVNVQAAQVAHVTAGVQRGASNSPAPLTVTVTHNPTASAAQGNAVTFTTTPTVQQLPTPSQPDQSTQQQQTVATILQTQRQAAQHTVQVQHTPSTPLASQTIHIQSTGQVTQGQPQSSSQSPQTVAQGKTTYSMRTRNQSKPQ